MNYLAAVKHSDDGAGPAPEVGDEEYTLGTRFYAEVRLFVRVLIPNEKYSWVSLYCTTWCCIPPVRVPCLYLLPRSLPANIFRATFIRKIISAPNTTISSVEGASCVRTGEASTRTMTMQCSGKSKRWVRLIPPPPPPVPAGLHNLLYTVLHLISICCILIL